MRKIQVLLAQPDPVGAAMTIDEKRLVAVELVNQSAGKARTKWATSVEFQGETYQMKRDESKDWTADNDIDPASIPHLVEEAAAMDDTVGNIAGKVLAADSAWRNASAKIEGLRKGADRAINAAVNEAEIRAALRVSWPTP